MEKTYQVLDHVEELPINIVDPVEITTLDEVKRQFEGKLVMLENGPGGKYLQGKIRLLAWSEYSSENHRTLWDMRTLHPTHISGHKRNEYVLHIKKEDHCAISNDLDAMKDSEAPLRAEGHLDEV